MDLQKMENAIKKEDYQVLNDEPLILRKYGKNITIRPVKWRHWDDFSYHMGMFLRYYYIMCGDAELPACVEDADKFIESFRKPLSNKKALKRILKMAKISGISRWFMRRHFTLHDYAELFVYMYLMNIKVVKKNCKIALSLIAPMLLSSNRAKGTNTYTSEKSSDTQNKR
jgi:hypothetical protein